MGRDSHPHFCETNEEPKRKHLLSHAGRMAERLYIKLYTWAILSTLTNRVFDLVQKLVSGPGTWTHFLKLGKNSIRVKESWIEMSTSTPLRDSHGDNYGYERLPKLPAAGITKPQEQRDLVQPLAMHLQIEYQNACS